MEASASGVAAATDDVQGHPNLSLQLELFFKQKVEDSPTFHLELDAKVFFFFFARVGNPGN
jgi:hypothetical protein